MTNKFNAPDDNQNTFVNETDDLSGIGNQNYENYYGEPASSDSLSTYNNSYAFTSENSPKPKKKRKNFILKSAIFVLCLAVVHSETPIYTLSL